MGVYVKGTIEDGTLFGVVERKAKVGACSADAAVNIGDPVVLEMNDTDYCGIHSTTGGEIGAYEVCHAFVCKIEALYYVAFAISREVVSA